MGIFIFLWVVLGLTYIYTQIIGSINEKDIQWTVNPKKCLKAIALGEYPFSRVLVYLFLLIVGPVFLLMEALMGTLQWRITVLRYTKMVLPGTSKMPAIWVCQRNAIVVYNDEAKKFNPVVKVLPHRLLQLIKAYEGQDDWEIEHYIKRFRAQFTDYYGQALEVYTVTQLEYVVEPRFKLAYRNATKNFRRTKMWSPYGLFLFLGNVLGNSSQQYFSELADKYAEQP